MIFQLKVQLINFSPPVWRRLQVDSEMTFHEMHEVLQVAFEWEDSHLHSYSVRRKNAERVKDVKIGPKFEEYDFLPTAELDEKTEKLSDWFVQEKDRTLYTYDLGDNWEHDIVLEKILSKAPGEKYPRCEKAMRLAPEEDSRGMESDEPIKEMDWRELTEEVNVALSTLVTVGVDGHSDSFDWKGLFVQAKEFNGVKPWKYLDDNQIFVVVDPVSEKNLYCSILGGAGEEFGMAIYIGDEGFDALIDTFEGTKPTLDLVFQQRSILLSFVDSDELESADSELIKQHDMTFNGTKQCVQFRSFVPGVIHGRLTKRKQDFCR